MPSVQLNQTVYFQLDHDKFQLHFNRNFPLKKIHIKCLYDSHFTLARMISPWFRLWGHHFHSILTKEHCLYCRLWHYAHYTCDYNWELPFCKNVLMIDILYDCILTLLMLKFHQMNA